MGDASDKTDLYLTELAELGLSCARNLSERLCKAADEKGRAQLRRAYHLAMKSVQETLDLQQRLRRERIEDAREERMAELQDLFDAAALDPRRPLH